MAASCDNSGKTESAAYNALLELMLSDSVPVISVAELSSAKDSVTILDTRDSKEYSVSRIPGAIYVGFDTFDIDEVNHLSKNKPVVVYCSVGYRSEKIGEKLLDAGFDDVKNLYGGIFEWVNQNQTVVDDDGPTQRIHPYSMLWSMWINNDQIKTAYEDSK